jgi:hypothetical protein
MKFKMGDIVVPTENYDKGTYAELEILTSHFDKKVALAYDKKTNTRVMIYTKGYKIREKISNWKEELKC